MEKSELKLLNSEHRLKTIEELVIKTINEKYSDYNLCLDSLASELNYHPAYLSSLFKNQVGVGISYFIRKIRFEKAYAMLLDGESVNQTAKKVGYDNAKSFSRAFKKQYGVIPSELFTK